MRPLITLGVLLASAPAIAGDLYTGGNWPALASDRKAAQVGDLLTIQVLANNSASNTVSKGSRKRTSLDGSISLARESGDTRFARSAELGLDGRYDGEGTSVRADRVAAQLSATVREVLPNGDLIVAGWQSLDVGGERTNITISGRVRPEDISADNAVVSSRLAEARIEYDGKGFATRSAKPGVVTRIFNWLGLL